MEINPLWLIVWKLLHSTGNLFFFCELQINFKQFIIIFDFCFNKSFKNAFCDYFIAFCPKF